MSLTTTTGGNALIPQSMDAAVRLAEMMARGKLVPTHLQSSPGDCLMVIEQATRWGMSPFAVAQSTSVIQGKLMFEGKLVAAALHTSGALSTRLSYDYTGEGSTRVVRVSATLAGENAPRFVDVRLTDARTTNKMWTTQPDQQLAYHGARVWARRYAPEVMLGVYAPEEMEPAQHVSAPHPGPTIEARAEVVETPAEPPKRMLGQFLDDLEVRLRNAATWEAVSVIAADPDVLRAQETARNGMAERLSGMLDAARERTMLHGYGGAGVTEEKEAAIRAAATAAHHARAEFLSWAATNRPADPAEALQQTVEYELARARMYEAEATLRALQDPTP